MEEEKKNGQPDRAAIEAMQREQVAKGLSDEKEYRRTELNALLELHSMLENLIKEIHALHDTMTILGSDKLTEYFKQLSDNVKKEERRQNTLAKVHASHKKARKTK